MTTENQTCSCGLKKPAKTKLTLEPSGDSFLSCGDSTCKEKLEKELADTAEREKYYQGKNPKAYESSATIVFYTILAVAGLTLGVLLHKLYTSFL